MATQQKFKVNHSKEIIINEDDLKSVNDDIKSVNDGAKIDYDKLNNTGASYQLATEVIENLCESCTIRFDIAYQSNRNCTKFNNKWKIKVMGKTFVDADFILAVKKATEFVLTAHNVNINKL